MTRSKVGCSFIKILCESPGKEQDRSFESHESSEPCPCHTVKWTRLRSRETHGVPCWRVMQRLVGLSRSVVLTSCNPMDCSLPGFSVLGISQARILEWVAISFSRGLPDPGIEPVSPALQADYVLLSHQGSPGMLSIYFNY